MKDMKDMKDANYTGQMPELLKISEGRAPKKAPPPPVLYGRGGKSSENGESDKTSDRTSAEGEKR